MSPTNGDSDKFCTPITRYYIDVRPYAPINPENHLRSTAASRAVEQLPLITTLPEEKQDSIRKYVRKPDRYMSLASELLKYYFIHKTARIPWSEVVVHRTPKPHNRPFWSPPNGWWRSGFDGLEFNVTHQAGLVLLVGCQTPTRSRDTMINEPQFPDVHRLPVINPDPMAVSTAENEMDEDEPEEVRIGVDVACTWEPPRTQDLSTQEKFNEWVEIFDQMFSEREQEDMKYADLNTPDDQSEADWRARRFYTYWSLKEAYIKMVGEGLIAPWLRYLEFFDVPVPQTPPASTHDVDQWTILSEEEVKKLQVLFKNRSIGHTMHTSLEAFQETFLVATMTRGVRDLVNTGTRWQRLDFLDIEQCATGNCRCL